MTEPMIDITDRLAEDIVSVLDYLSRVLQGAEKGQRHYVWEKSHGLTRAARRLHCTLSQPMLPGERADLDEIGDRGTGTTFDPERVRRMVQRDARHYRVGHALYPPTEAEEAERRRIAAEVERVLGDAR